MFWTKIVVPVLNSPSSIHMSISFNLFCHVQYYVNQFLLFCTTQILAQLTQI